MPLNLPAVPPKALHLDTDPFGDPNVAATPFIGLVEEELADLVVGIYTIGYGSKTLVIATGFTNGQAHRFIDRVLPLFAGKFCFDILYCP